MKKKEKYGKCISDVIWKVEKNKESIAMQSIHGHIWFGQMRDHGGEWPIKMGRAKTLIYSLPYTL